MHGLGIREYSKKVAVVEKPTIDDDNPVIHSHDGSDVPLTGSGTEVIASSVVAAFNANHIGALSINYHSKLIFRSPLHKESNMPFSLKTFYFIPTCSSLDLQRSVMMNHIFLVCV